jgi:hypothetical protein
MYMLEICLFKKNISKLNNIKKTLLKNDLNYFLIKIKVL